VTAQGGAALWARSTLGIFLVAPDRHGVQLDGVPIAHKADLAGDCAGQLIVLLLVAPQPAAEIDEARQTVSRLLRADDLNRVCAISCCDGDVQTTQRQNLGKTLRRSRRRTLSDQTRVQ
jgi:hypothetical protein